MNPFQPQPLLGRIHSPRAVLDALGIGGREGFVENREHNMMEVKKTLTQRHDASASDAAEPHLGLENAVGRDAGGWQI